MPFLAMTCPSCGAALPPNAKLRVVVCAFCGASVTYDQRAVKRADYRLALEAECRTSTLTAERPLRLGEEIYEIVAPLGVGESSEVRLVARCDGPKELLVMKLPHSTQDVALLEREWCTLYDLLTFESPQASYLARRLPMPRRRLPGASSHDVGTAYAYAYQSGFFQTLDDVANAHPGGIEAEAAVWLWRRGLETLMLLCEAGYVHGAILPCHMLVHARDHGVLIVGWSMGQKHGAEPLHSAVEGRLGFYPSQLLNGTPLRHEHDLVMLARCIACTLASGAGFEVPRTFPEPLSSLLAGTLDEDPRRHPAASARELHQLVGNAARQVFGPPRYRPFAMPGWK